MSLTSRHDPKIRNFIISLEMFKMTMNLYKMFFFHKINKNIQRKSGMKYLYIRAYSVTQAGFKTL